MAEIKSSLELAMERTKGMAISKEEKEEIKQKEIVEKANGLSHRYQEDHLPLHEVLREIERMEEKKGKTVKEILLSQWIDALSLKDEDERLLKGIESLKPKRIDELKEKHQHLSSQYQKEKEAVRHKVKKELMESLRGVGIDGDAVEPNIEGSDLWKNENEKLDFSYRIKLGEIKEQLREL